MDFFIFQSLHKECLFLNLSFMLHAMLPSTTNLTFVCCMLSTSFLWRKRVNFYMRLRYKFCAKAPSNLVLNPAFGSQSWIKLSCTLIQVKNRKINKNLNVAFHAFNHVSQSSLNKTLCFIQLCDQ